MTRLARTFVLALVAGFLAVPAASIASLHAAASPEPGRQERVEVAAWKGSSRGKEPERGSSATLYGGSSADRYGGTSADRTGVAGQRDKRVYKRPSDHRDEDRPRKEENADDQDIEEE